MSGEVGASDEQLIREGYAAFNERDIERALRTMTRDVSWANGMEGGKVLGHAGVREYWTRQFDTIRVQVDPLAMMRTDDGRIAVSVHQVVCNTDGEVLADRNVMHIYRVRDGLVEDFEIGGD